MKSLMKDCNFDGLRILVSINSVRNCLEESSARILRNIKLTFQGCISVISATPSHCLHHLIQSCPLCYQCVNLHCATYSMTPFQGNISTVHQWTSCSEW